MSASHRPFRPYRPSAFWRNGQKLVSGASPLDADDQDFIAFVREHGRLPGSGAQEAWGVFGARLFDTYAASAGGGMRRAAQRSVAADRQRSPYLNEEQMIELRARWAREDNERREERIKIARERMRRDLDYADQRAELREEERRWRQREHRLAILPEQRRNQWQLEERDWREFERNKLLAERRREVKLMRGNWNYTRAARAEAKQKAAAERTAAASVWDYPWHTQETRDAAAAAALERRRFAQLPSNQQMIADARAQLERQWELHRAQIKRRHLLIPNGERRFHYRLKREADGLWHFRRETLINA